MRTNPHSRQRGFTWVELLVLIVVLVALAGIAAPKLIRIRGGRSHDTVWDMNNGKRLILALTDFSNEFGSFPDRETAKIFIEANQGNLMLEGDHSNDYFRQLIAAGVIKSEQPFHVQTPYSPKRPDNNLSGAEALKAGEVGFGYIMNGSKALPSDSPKRIILVAPLLNAAATGEFDASVMFGKALLVRIDQTVEMVPIGKDKKAIIGPNRTLLDTGEGTIWGKDIKPVIKPPLKR